MELGITFRTDGFINIINLSKINVVNEENYTFYQYEILHEKVTIEFYKKILNISE